MPQSNQGFDQLTLTVAFDAGDTDDLARMDLELDAVDRGVPPVVVNNERLELQDRRPRAGRLFIDLEHDRPANHQPSQVRRARFPGGGRRDDFAMAHDGDAVGDIDDFTELMRDKNNRLAFFGEAAKNFEETLRLLGGEHGGRLIHDQQPRAAIERLEELDPLLHADGEIGDSSLWIDIESVAGSQRGDFMARLCEVHRADGADGLVPQDHVLGNGEWG